MTCFWDETLKGLSYFPEFTELEEYDIISRNGSKNRKNYIDFCKKNCDILLTKYKNVIWEGFEKNERDQKMFPATLYCSFPLYDWPPVHPITEEMS